VARWLTLLAATAVLVLIGLVGMANRQSQDRRSAIYSDGLLLGQKITAARVAFDRAAYDEAALQVASAYKIAKRHRLADAMADCLRLEGDILAAGGALEEAADRYRQALPLWGPLLPEDDDAPDAASVAVHYSPGPEGRSADHGLACLLNSYAVVEARLGRIDAAEDRFHEALQLCRALNDPGLVAAALRGLGSVEAVRGNAKQARKWYTAAGLALAEKPDEAFQRNLRALEALLQRDEGRLGEASTELGRCLDEWRQAGHPRWIAATLLQIASVHAREGRPEQAISAASEAGQLYARVGDRRGVALCESWKAWNLEASSAPSHLAEDYF